MNPLADGVEQLSRRDFRAARDSLLEATRLAPDSARAWGMLARAHVGLQERVLAEQAARRAIALDPDRGDVMHVLGALLAETGDAVQGEAWLRRAAILNPDDPALLRDLGACQIFIGDLDAARGSLMRAVELDPLAHEAIDTLTRLQPMNDGSPRAEALFALLLRLAGDADRMSPAGRGQVLFGLGKALEDRGDIDGAFACLARANTEHRAGLTFDIGAAERWLASIAEAFDQPCLEPLRGEGLTSDRPIFIVGMPRSGTSLIEQIIAAHPAVHGAGELPNLTRLVASSRGRDGATYPRWARTMNGQDCRAIGQAYLDSLPAFEPGQTRVTDKWLDNFEHLGLIHACLPNAVIIHCQRDPRDVGLSCFGIRFSESQAFSYDLTEFGRYWRAYDRLMEHWRRTLPPGRMLETPYEAVVADVEGWARRLIAHCGLDWDDACLRFHESRRQVRTASFAQVRRPIYADSVGRWRRFARHLGPLLEALGPPWSDAGG